jgi:hypothetical protein
MELNREWIALIVTIIVITVVFVVYLNHKSSTNTGTSQLGGPPPPPTQLSATNLSSTSVTLVWETALSAAGYDVQYQTTGSTKWIDFNTVASTSAIITGLTPAMSYNFQVMAVNSFGSSTAVTLTGTQLPNTNGDGGDPGITGGDPPTTPTNVAISSVTPTTVTLSWQGDGSAIEYQVFYQVATSTPSDSMVLFGITPFNSLIVAGLVPNVTYNFGLVAVNNYGASSGVSVQNIQLPSGTSGSHPDIATNIVSSNVTSTSVDLSWSQPTSTTSAGAAIQYNISYQIAGSSSWVTYTTTNNTSLTISGLVPSTSYNFGVTCVNNYGTSLLSSLSNVQTKGLGASGMAPTAPTSLQASNVTTNFTTLTWVPPVSGPTSSLAVQYNVLYQTVGSNSTPDGWIDFGVTSNNSITVTGLDSYVSYNFQVVGINNYGSSPSAALNGVLIPGPSSSGTVPVMPTNVSAASTSNGTVTLSWTSVTDASEYQIMYQLSGTSGGWFVFGTTVNTTSTITSLVPGATYNFSVSALNNYGSSSPAAISGYQLPALTPTGSAPSTPTTLQYSNLNATSVTLTWVAPSTASGNGAAAEYEVLYQVTGSPASVWIEYGVTPSTTIAVTGLSTYATYNFQVSAINNYGTGIPAILSNVSVVGSISTGNPPSPPSGLAASSITSSSATLTWTAATGSNQYSISYQVAGSSAWVNFGTTSTTTTTVTGLTNNVSYNFSVVAINNFGVSSPAQTNNVLISQQVNASPPPSSPTGLQTTAVASNGVTLAWTAPQVTANNGAAVQYNLSYQVVGSENTPAGWVELGSVTNLSANVTGLISNAAYNFQVTAINNYGVSPSALLNSVLLPGYPTSGSVPTTPVGLTVLSTSVGQINLQWTADPSTNSWNVAYQLSGSSSNSWVEAGSSTTNTYTISNLVGYMTYNVSLIAVNNYGASPASILNNINVPGTVSTNNPPGFPTSLQGSSTSVNTVTLTWVAPTAGTGIGNPAQYNISYQVNGSSASAWVPWGSVTTNTATISGLSSYLSYNFNVTSANNGGISSPSTLSNISVLGPITSGTAPGNVTSLQVGSSTPGSVTLNWGAPTTGSAVAQYDVTYQLSGTSSWTNFGSIVTKTATITGLTASATYNFGVTAINNYGSSSQSTLNAVVVPSNGGNPPGTPTGIQCTPASSNVSLSWTAPTVSGGVGVPAEYNIQYQIVGTGASWYNYGTTSATSIAVSGLVAYTTYNFSITAINNYGAGTAGTASNILLTAPTTPSAPASPTGLQETSITNNSVTLSWIAPTTGASVVQYNVMYQVYGSGSSPGAWINWGNVATTNATVTGLTSYLTYNFSVSSVNNGGSSAPAVLNSITVTGASSTGNAPGSPTGLTISSTTPTSATLQWTAPTVTASVGAASQYTIAYQTSGSGPTAWINFGSVTTLTATVPNLTSYANYNFSVVATNNYGSSTAITITNIPVPSSGGTGNVPTTPTGFVLDPHSSGWASNVQGFQWTVPTGITQYIFSYQLSGSTLWYDISVSGSLLQINSSTRVATFLMDSLSPGTKYNFQLSAVNNYGTSVPAVITGITVLAAPTDLTVVESSGNVMATWNPISSPPSNTQYLLVYGLNGTDPSTWSSVTTPSTSISIPVNGNLSVGNNTFFVSAFVQGSSTYAGFNDTQNNITIS